MVSGDSGIKNRISVRTVNLASFVLHFSAIPICRPRISIRLANPMKPERTRVSIYWSWKLYPRNPLILRSGVRVADPHVRIDIFLIQQILAVTGTHPEKPGMMFSQDLEGEMPFQDSQRKRVECRRGIDRVPFGNADTAVDHLRKSLLHRVIDGKKTGDQADGRKTRYHQCLQILSGIVSLAEKIDQHEECKDQYQFR